MSDASLIEELIKLRKQMPMSKEHLAYFGYTQEDYDQGRPPSLTPQHPPVPRATGDERIHLRFKK